MAIALLANTLATGAALVCLILTFGPISGAHFNPAVTLADSSQGGLRWREVSGYLAAQIAGAFAGVAAAHAMFGKPPSLACTTPAARRWRLRSSTSSPIRTRRALSPPARRRATASIPSSSTSCATDALARQAQLLVTMGCGDQCPVVPGLLRDDWPLEDPGRAPCPCASASSLTQPGFA